MFRRNRPGWSHRVQRKTGLNGLPRHRVNFRICFPGLCQQFADRIGVVRPVAHQPPNNSDRFRGWRFLVPVPFSLRHASPSLVWAGPSGTMGTVVHRRRSVRASAVADCPMYSFSTKRGTIQSLRFVSPVKRSSDACPQNGRERVLSPAIERYGAAWPESWQFRPAIPGHFSTSLALPGLFIAGVFFTTSLWVKLWLTRQLTQGKEVAYVGTAC